MSLQFSSTECCSRSQFFIESSKSSNIACSFVLSSTLQLCDCEVLLKLHLQFDVLESLPAPSGTCTSHRRRRRPTVEPPNATVTCRSVRTATAGRTRSGRRRTTPWQERCSHRAWLMKSSLPPCLGLAPRGSRRGEWPPPWYPRLPRECRCPTERVYDCVNHYFVL